MTVNKGSPTVPAPTLSIPTSTTVGTSETLSVTISGSGATPTGTATFQVKLDSGSYSAIGSAVALISGGRLPRLTLLRRLGVTSSRWFTVEIVTIMVLLRVLLRL